MPTAEIKCQPDWLPPDRVVVDVDYGPRVATTMAIAGELPRIIRWAIMLVDGIPEGHPDAPGVTGIRIGFEPEHGQAMNDVPLRIIAHPPEIDGDFDERRVRRGRIARIIFDELWSYLFEHIEHLVIPLWELEVIPVETSGCGSNGFGEINYPWGGFALDPQI